MLAFWLQQQYNKKALRKNIHEGSAERLKQNFLKKL